MTVAYKRLGDVATFVRGITFKPTDVVPAGTPSSVWCMRTKNVQGQVDLSDVWSVDSRFVKRSDQYLEEGDVLISSANSWNLVGKCCWIPRLGKASSFGGFVTALRGDVSQVNRRYLYRWFSSAHIQETARSFSRQTTNIANLDLKRCADLSVPLPPLAEQKRIAAVLDQVDALRAKRREAIALLDDLAQSTFLDMFGDPLTNPKGWPVLPFGEVCETRLGKMLDAKRETGRNSRPYLRNANVQWMRIDTTDLLEMDFGGKDKITYGLAPGDLMICEGGEPGRAAIWRGEVEDCYFQKALHRARPNVELARAEYLVWMLRILSLRGGLSDHVSTATISHLTGAKLKVLPIFLPPLGLQQEFASRLDAVEEMGERHELHLATLDELFESVQQRAFAGQLWDHEAA
ncbi:restriction endonuclease subunit S [Streptomyces sp. NBC_01358]|uniref:restriction endonuclease subunit S n=1 Tax=Streptomyces sp. NBC_01358 TaxID=2903837 RepID=UPI002E35D356|nr:restriction endonuclease subunit S [Streptomyces sp. NBC_01358]